MKKERLYRALVVNENGEREIIETTNINKSYVLDDMYTNGYTKVICITWLKEGTFEYEYTLKNKPYLSQYLMEERKGGN